MDCPISQVFAAMLAAAPVSVDTVVATVPVAPPVAVAQPTAHRKPVHYNAKTGRATVSVAQASGIEASIRN